MSFSILRYPGGKGRFANVLKVNIESSGCKTLIEPFAGGAAAGLTLLENGTINRLILVELDHRVAAFWKKIKNDSGFAKQIRDFEGAPKLPLLRCDSSLKKRRNNLNGALKRLEKDDLGMWTLVKNRCSFGGYLNGGLLLKGFGKPTAEKAKKGAEGSGYQGVGSQWNSDSLAKRVEKAHEQFCNGNIIFIEGDAFKELPKHPEAFAFIDAPYSCGIDAPGRGLYQNHQVDHKHLFDVLKRRAAPWLATYNDSSDVRTLAKEYEFEINTVKMSRLHANADKRARETAQDNHEKIQPYKEVVLTPKGQKFKGS